VRGVEPRNGEVQIWKGTAPAKVNLFLRILAREEGGFHQIETLFQALDLADPIAVEVSIGGGSETVALEVIGKPVGPLGPPESNLVVRAARQFLGAAKLEDGIAVRIRLEKRIPIGGGLGGGSSDAATTLRALDELLPGAVPRDRLVALAGTLGADVPFFLQGLPLALGWGRGDQLFPLPPLPSRPVLLLIPKPGISTPWAYAALADHRRDRGLGNAPARVLPAALSGLPGGGGEAEDRWATVERLAENAFEAALAPHRPELAKLKAALHEAGASCALLSGSGSTVFGAFRTDAEADRAEALLAREYPSLRQIRTSTRSDPWGRIDGPA